MQAEAEMFGLLGRVLRKLGIPWPRNRPSLNALAMHELGLMIDDRPEAEQLTYFASTLDAERLRRFELEWICLRFSASTSALLTALEQQPNLRDQYGLAQVQALFRRLRERIRATEEELALVEQRLVAYAATEDALRKSAVDDRRLTPIVETFEEGVGRVRDPGFHFLIHQIYCAERLHRFELYRRIFTPGRQFEA